MLGSCLHIHEKCVSSHSAKPLFVGSGHPPPRCKGWPGYHWSLLMDQHQPFLDRKSANPYTLFCKPPGTPTNRCKRNIEEPLVVHNQLIIQTPSVPNQSIIFSPLLPSPAPLAGAPNSFTRNQKTSKDLKGPVPQKNRLPQSEGRARLEAASPFKDFGLENSSWLIDVCPGQRNWNEQQIMYHPNIKIQHLWYKSSAKVHFGPIHLTNASSNMTHAHEGSRWYRDLLLSLLYLRFFKAPGPSLSSLRQNIIWLTGEGSIPHNIYLNYFPQCNCLQNNLKKTAGSQKGTPPQTSENNL